MAWVQASFQYGAAFALLFFLFLLVLGIDLFAASIIVLVIFWLYLLISESISCELSASFRRFLNSCQLADPSFHFGLRSFSISTFSAISMNVGIWSDPSVLLMTDHSHLFASELDANDKSNTLVPPCGI